MDEPSTIEDALASVLKRGMQSLASEDEIRAWEGELAVRNRRERLAASGIDERLDADGAEAIVHDRALDTRALQLVRAWVASSRPALVLLGDRGQGKTVAAAWALARCAGRYVRASDLCEMREAGWRQRDAYQRHLRTELLVVDELGTEADLTAAARMLQDVVDARQRRPRLTLLLGNQMSREELAERYDPRTLDRLGTSGDEHGIALFRLLRGRSLRAGAYAR